MSKNPYKMTTLPIRQTNQEKYINEMYNKGYELIAVTHISYTTYYYWKQF